MNFKKIIIYLGSLSALLLAFGCTKPEQPVAVPEAASEPVASEPAFVPAEPVAEAPEVVEESKPKFETKKVIVQEITFKNGLMTEKKENEYYENSKLKKSEIRFYPVYISNTNYAYEVSHTLEYTEYGDCYIDYYTYSDGGNRVNKYGTIEYDENGNIIKEDYEYYANSQQRHIFTYEYDDSGNVIKEMTFLNDIFGLTEDVQPYKITENIYNDKDLLIEKTIVFYDKKLERSYKYTYEYDEKGNKTNEYQHEERLWYETNEIDTEDRHDSYEYDNNNELIKQETFDKDGNLTFWYKYERFEDGKVKKRENSAGEIAEYERDSDGKVLKEYTTNAEGEIENWIEYERNENGDVTKQIIHYKNGDNLEETYTYQYEYIEMSVPVSEEE